MIDSDGTHATPVEEAPVIIGPETIRRLASEGSVDIGPGIIAASDLLHQDPYAALAAAKAEIDRLTAERDAARAEADRLRKAVDRLIKDHINLMEIGRDRIVALGGSCDPVDVMEAHSPALRAARAALQPKDAQTP